MEVFVSLPLVSTGSVVLKPVAFAVLLASLTLVANLPHVSLRSVLEFYNNLGGLGTE